MSDEHDGLLRPVNASGFLLQMRVQNEIERTQREHNWSVASSEHRWVESVTGAEGFIDLVLEQPRNRMRMVLECKRVTDAHWVFLTPNESATKQHRLRVPWTDSMDGKERIIEWADFVAKPDSEEAEFCVLVRQGDRDQLMLEKLGGTLLRSVEALAEEELESDKRKFTTHRVYIPVVVTTAQLHLCRFDLGSVDLCSGTLPVGHFEQVPFIRFRKSLSTNHTASGQYDHLRDRRLTQDRTVLILQAAGLVEFLKSFRLQAPAFDEWPWTTARQLRRDLKIRDEVMNKLSQGAVGQLGR